MANNSVSTQSIRAKVQQILGSNTAWSGGDFHSDDLSADSFLHELNKKFKLTPKEEGVDSSDLLEEIIKLSTVKVRGRFNAKELKQSVFLNKLFENFEIEKI